MPLLSFAGAGRRGDLDAEIARLGEPGLSAARVLAQHGGRWLVTAADDAAAGRLVPARGRLRSGPERAPVTGDWVALDRHGAIAHVLERRGAIVRRAAGTFGSQLLAANVELVLVCEPLPEPNERRAERICALAHAGGVPAALLLTKADLDPAGATQAGELAQRLALARGTAVSVHDDGSLAELTALLERGTTTVLLGPSGAGKSTLVNALLGSQRQATGAIRASAGGRGRGRHTTVTRDLIALPTGALIIDTPGIREAGLWDGLGDSFADLERLAAGCRFSDCAHDGEPDCAVVEHADLHRVAAWRKLQREQAWVDAGRVTSRR